MNAHKAGFAAIIGRPNVGKSTLLNRLLGQKVAIVTPRSQTTRNLIKGILTEPEYQIVFLDTPGIHKPKNKLGEYMMKEQKGSVDGVDCVIAMLAADEFFGPLDREMLTGLSNMSCPVFLVINKTDSAGKEEIDALKAKALECAGITDVFEISALNGDNIGALLEAVVSVMPEGPAFFPDDIVSDYPEKFLASEVIREKMLMLLKEEVPHGTGVEIEKMQQRSNGTTYILANILCERDSHKGIIIGKNGSMLKKIGAEARLELEELLQCPIYLELFVKVQKDWRNSQSVLKQLGYSGK
ncbi:MAG TPA: GTPase Era [Firmicutes bacterium]|nr:GTPase Era [Bacillota bacterium]